MSTRIRKNISIRECGVSRAVIFHLVADHQEGWACTNAGIGLFGIHIDF